MQNNEFRLLPNTLQKNEFKMDQSPKLRVKTVKPINYIKKRGEHKFQPL